MLNRAEEIVEERGGTTRPEAHSCLRRSSSRPVQFTSAIVALRRGVPADAISKTGRRSISNRRPFMTMTKVLGFAATAALLVLAVPSQQAGAASLINPGAAAAVQNEVQVAPPMATQVHWHRYHHWHRGYHGHWHHWHHHHRHW